jgi:hypothetical protein
VVYPTRAVIIKLFRPLVAGHLHPPGREAAKALPPPSSRVAEANSPTHQSRNIVRAMADAGALSSCNHKLIFLYQSAARRAPPVVTAAPVSHPPFLSSAIMTMVVLATVQRRNVQRRR